MLSKLEGEMVLSFCIIGITQAWHLLILIDQAGFFCDGTVQIHCFPIGRFSSFLLKHLPLHPTADDMTCRRQFWAGHGSLLGICFPFFFFF